MDPTFDNTPAFLGTPARTRKPVLQISKALLALACAASASLAHADGILDVTNFAYFKLINDFLRDEIDTFQWNLLSNTASLVGSVALLLLTLWMAWQGFRIVTGRTQQPMMMLVGDSLKAFLIISFAVGTAGASSELYWGLTDGTANAITQLVSRDSTSPYKSIDENLGYMEGLMAAIDSLSGGISSVNAEVNDAKTRAKWFTGIGVAGPSVVGGAILLMNKIAIALFVGLGPLFIMCLLFEQTKSLFSKWLFYGIGTVFSLAVLSFMVALSTKLVGAVALAYLIKYSALLMTDAGGGEGITSMAMQQGGLGLILSMLIVSTPPMAAAFFQGTLGQFAAYSAFGSVGSRGGGGDAGRLARGQMPEGSNSKGSSEEEQGRRKH